MSTNPFGRTFISYRRTQLESVGSLTESLRELGVPTWRDVDDLGSRQTESELRSTLQDDETSSAVLWITPDVSESSVIREVEVPAVLRRARTRDAFFVVGVACGGLGYEAAADVAGDRFLATRLAGWNLEKIPAVEGLADRQRVALTVLRNRLDAVAVFGDDAEELTVRIGTRSIAPNPPGLLTIDWRHRFRGGVPSEQTWSEALQPALGFIRDELTSRFRDRRILFDGDAHLPVAVALGRTFRSTARLRTGWRQFNTDLSEAVWSLDATPADSQFRAEELDSDPSQKDLAILVSVARNVEPGFAVSRGKLQGFRAVVHIHRGAETARVLDPGEGLDVAKLMAETIRSSVSKFNGSGVVHLFTAVPAGLSFLFGQLSNSLGPIQTYEHIDDTTVGYYVPSALLGRTV